MREPRLGGQPKTEKRRVLLRSMFQHVERGMLVAQTYSDQRHRKGRDIGSARLPALKII